MNFITFARMHGVEINPSRLFPSQKIQRCGTTNKPRSGNGAYFWDGDRGWVMDWSGEAKVVWFSDPNAKPWTEEEKRAWAAKRDAEKQLQWRRYEEAAKQAEVTLKSAVVEEHVYLKFKGFPEERGLVLEDKLLIPMRNVGTNALQGYQAIWWNQKEMKYEKKMMTGMRAKHAVLFMGNRTTKEVWLVEGYATGLSVRHALKSCGLHAAVVVCFSASNLVQVAERIPGNRFVFADNDASMTGQQAAEDTKLPWVMADEEGWDANDLHVRNGLFAVANKIMMCRVGASRYA